MQFERIANAHLQRFLTEYILTNWWQQFQSFIRCCIHCCGLQMPHVSFDFLQSQSILLYRRPMFVLVSLFLVCLPVFLLLLSAEYHNVLMCFSCVPHNTTFCVSSISSKVHVISVTRGWVGIRFAEKSITVYITPEWPLYFCGHRLYLWWDHLVFSSSHSWDTPTRKVKLWVQGGSRLSACVSMVCVTNHVCMQLAALLIHSSFTEVLTYLNVNKT